MSSEDQTITIILHGDKADKEVPVTVNGVTKQIPRRVETQVHPAYVEALRNSGYDFHVVVPDGAEVEVGAPTDLGTDTADRDGPDDSHAKAGQVDKEFAPAGYQPAEGAAGTQDEADDGFDADAVITGTVEQVKAKLAELTPAQRAKVLAAEKDREQPRKGVLDALAAIAEPQANA
ncbi:hypothetical protein [Sphingomonas sp.]|uniref:hypothetical protein n=1 Tax=Sphingomonas sp. TaxID=28214 RepID=UPI00307F5069